MSQPISLDKSAPLSLPHLPAVPTPVITTPENTTTREGTFDSTSDASSDYGSDFSPDEEELLNLLLARIGEDHERLQVASSSGSGSPSEFTTPALSPVTVFSGSAGGQDGVATVQLPSPPPAPVTDIEEYAGISRDGVPRVLGRKQWSSISQRTEWGMRSFGGGRGRGRGKGGMEQEYSGWGAEHPDSPEGRGRERRRELEREQKQIAAEQGVQIGNGPSVSDMRSPLERFRKPPRKALSVTDLVSPAWCELQYWYTLTKFGRKTPTPAMKQGTMVHKELEDQVHTTVPIEVMTREDGWALRIWNVIQGLHTLRVSGMTRELEVWGNVDGEIVTGIIDQLSYECPDDELEASAEARYADLRTSKALLPEYQTSITEFFLSPAGGGRRLSDIGVTKAEQNAEASTTTMTSETPTKKIYITDIKTRGKSSRSIPSVNSTGFRPTHLQLQLYYHFLTRLATTDDVTIDDIAARYNLQTDKPFSDSFIAQIGSLNEQFFDASQDLDVDYIPPSSGTEREGEFPSSIQDSMTILEHNSLSRLWNLMKSQHRLTFLPPNTTDDAATVTDHPRTQDDLQQDTPLLTTILSPVLTATYITPPSSPDESMQYLGSRSFLFNSSSLYSYLADEMYWWRGHRQPRGVPVMEAWKCRICEFREECTWRREMEGKMAINKRRKREYGVLAEVGSGEVNEEGLLPEEGNGNGNRGNEGIEDVTGQSVV